MKVATKFIHPLTEEDAKKLKELMKKSPSVRVRMRAHSIIMNAEGISVDEIAKIYKVDRDTVSRWLERWNSLGFDGLRDKPRSGRPPKLSPEEKRTALDLIYETPQSIKMALAKLIERIGKRISIGTLKNCAKKVNLSWKRIKKVPRQEPGKKKFDKAKLELQKLQEQHKSGLIDLRYFDATGFSLKPVVPYAWQPKGSHWQVPCSGYGPRLNVLGFLNIDNEFEPFCFQCSVDSEIVVRCFDEFCCTITKKTVVVVDNSPMHTSEEFKGNIPRWRKRRLVVKYLPTYSPKLNLIEILWRFIKYQWLGIDAYSSFSSLVDSVQNILAKIGSEYHINFSCSQNT